MKSNSCDDVVIVFNIPLLEFRVCDSQGHVSEHGSLWCSARHLCLFFWPRTRSIRHREPHPARTRQITRRLGEDAPRMAEDRDELHAVVVRGHDGHGDRLDLASWIAV